MPFFEAVRLALETIRVQKLKSFFTLTGVMIGVMFLIAVVSIVEGMADYVENDFAAKIIGTNTFYVSRAPDFQDISDEEWRRIQRRPRFYPPAAQVVREALAGGPFRSAIENGNFSPAVVPGIRPRSVQAVATEANYFDIKQYEIAQGRAFTTQEVALGTRVVVVGSEVASYYYAGLDPLGRELRISGIPYTIIGVIAPQGSVFGFSLDRLAVVPYTTPLSRLMRPRGDVEKIIVQAPTREILADGEELVRGALRGFRGLGPAEEDDFAISSSESALSFFDELKGKLVLFGTALPAIGLIVGALVIMNIMLVAVAERTREIGVRKALGARRRDIIAQFLVEASTLSIIGAMIGALLGILLAKLIAAVTPLPASVAPWSLVAALVVGAGVGIAAGIYPASRASRLDPITALRQE